MLLAGCGYSSGLHVAERHATIGLEVFGNDSYERDLEQPLYQHIARVLRDDSDAVLIDPRQADVVIRGRILTYHRRSGIRSPENKLLETGIYISAEADLFARGSDKPLRPKARADASIGYVLGVGGEEFEARDRALRHIAEELVLDLLSPLN